MASFSGKTKITLCKRLGNDWQDLADYFEIPSQQFEQGRECQAIWEWLETRDKLQELHEALRFIERDDLLSVLQALSQSIRFDEIHELKQILKSVNISDEQARAFYEQLSDNSSLPNWQGDLFRFLLDHLAKKSCTPPDKAPLLEFLERCHFLIDEPVQAKLREWKNQVALNLGIELDAICAKIKPTHSSDKTQTVPVLLIKIEPNLINEEVFQVKAWFFKNQDDDPEPVDNIPDQDYTRSHLEELILKILRPVVRKLFGKADDLIVEVILPLNLFDWNINHLQVKLGPKKLPLCTRYPLAIRSWERLYCNEGYDFAWKEWFNKWNACTSCQTTDATRFYCVCNEHDYCETLFDELEDSAWVFLALTPMPPTQGRKQMVEVMGTMLAAGIPFAFWTLEEPKQVENLREQIYHLLKQSVPENWPKEILQCRKNHKSEPLWNNINLLWDNPNRLPPDTDYLLEAPLNI